MSFSQSLLPRKRQTTRCAIYARSATAPNPLGIANQIENCRALARKNRWTVINGFVLADEGRSGNNATEREALQALLAMAQVRPRPYDCVICEDSSRLARDLNIAAEILDLFGDCGVEVYTSHGVRVNDLAGTGQGGRRCGTACLLRSPGFAREDQRTELRH